MMMSIFSYSWLLDWNHDAYQYPDINDIIDQEERRKEKQRAQKAGKKHFTPMDKHRIQIKLVLGQFVSNDELNYIYRNSTPKEVADLDRLFQGRISASAYNFRSERGKDHGYSEGYTAQIVETNGKAYYVMVLTSSPDRNIDENSGQKLHSVADVLQNNLHENFDEAVRMAVEMYPFDALKALKVNDAVSIRFDRCVYRRTESAWDQRLDDFKIDVIVAAAITVKVPADRHCGENVLLVYKEKQMWVDYRLRYTFDLYGKTGVKTCSGPTVMPADLFPPDAITGQQGWRTTEFLRPVFRKTDFPKIVRQMLKKIYPEALEESTAIDEYEFADAMSHWLDRRYHGMRLRIREAWLGKNGIRGLISFSKKKIMDGDGIPVEVQPGDIIINMEYIEEEWDRIAAIIHECLHVYLHLPFFMLQMMAGNPDYSYIDRLSDTTASLTTRAERDHVKWMEWQAEKMTPYVMMEEGTVRRECSRLLAIRRGDRSPETLEWIMKQLSAEYSSSCQMSKIRMEEVGIQKAADIWNFIDGKKKVPNFSAGSKRKDGAVYTIGFDDAVDLYMRSAEFARVIDSCRYVYIEGHYVLNHPKYVRTGENFKRYLTPHARKNIAECSLSFRIAARDKHLNYFFGAAARTDPLYDLDPLLEFLENNPDELERLTKLINKKK